MTSLNIAVGPVGDESSGTSGRINNCSSAGNVSSVGTVSINDHLPVENHTSVGAGCSCDHSSVYVPGVFSSSGLDDVPGETTTE